MKIRILLLIALLLCTSLIADAKKKSKKKEKNPTPVETPYQKFFKGKKCETVKGLITVHKMNGKVYFELPLKLLNKDMLLGSTITEITDNRFGSVGEKPQDPLHVVFMRQDSTIALGAVNARYITKETDIARRIAASTRPALMQVFKIETYIPDSTAVIVDMTNFLLSDNPKLSPFSDYAPITSGKKTVSKVFSRENSQIGQVKAFADNISIQSLLTYTVNVKGPKRAYLSDMPFTAVMTRSFLLLPEEPMRQRIADPRVGVFQTQRFDFKSRGKGAETVHFAQRWRLEPKDEAAYQRGELTEPKQPIVFYIDATFPKSWQKHVKEGVEEWQAAFEKIGFKNAIIAKDYPTDDPNFDPDNLKNSCVRYSPSLVANAMGPSWTDPRSGEIINASVSIYHNMVELVQSWRFIQTGQADPDVRAVVLPEKVLGDCIRYVVSHEIGHCLALMHNMAGSSGIPVDSLRSPSFTQKHGTTYSIMDYARNNYVAQPGDKERGVKLTPPRLGEYDYFAIKWLYTPLLDAATSEDEVTTLRAWIHEKCDNPVYRYGKQQILAKIDPTSLEEDLGDDAVAAATYGVKNLKYILRNMNNWVGAADPDYEFRMRMYNEVVYQYFRYLNHVLCNIGGIYLNEVYEGDARLCYQSVPKEQQKKALLFLEKELKEMTWLCDPQVLKGYPLMGNISKDIESLVVKSLVERFPDMALCAEKAEQNPYTQTEGITDFYDFIWQPTRQGKTLTDTEKRLQLTFLTEMITNSIPTASGSAKSLTSAALLDVPEYIKAKSREDYGILPVDAMGMFSNREETELDESRAGFDLDVYVTNPSISLSHVYFNLTKKTLALLKSQANTGDEDTRQHYQMLIYRIEQAMK